jgi:hypothetical protein
MMIVYDRNTGKIVGHCSRVFDTGQWRDATIAELYPGQDISHLAAAHFPDDARYLMHGAENWRLKKDENGSVVGIERLPTLHLTCDAADSDGDDVPDIPANGTSIAHISARTSDGADVEVTFRTTRGALNRRTVKSTGGTAAVDLRSGTETVSATVTATAPGYRPGRLHLEFTPVAASPNRRSR